MRNVGEHGSNSEGTSLLLLLLLPNSAIPIYSLSPTSSSQHLLLPASPLPPLLRFLAHIFPFFNNTSIIVFWHIRLKPNTALKTRLTLSRVKPENDFDEFEDHHDALGAQLFEEFKACGDDEV